jgi:hypothetical protein
VDAFGRRITEAQGFVYFISHGRKYLYCANTDLFKPELYTQVSRGRVGLIFSFF